MNLQLRIGCRSSDLQFADRENVVASPSFDSFLIHNFASLIASFNTYPFANSNAPAIREH